MPFKKGFSVVDKKAKRPVRTGTFRKPRRLLNQDYRTLLELCARTKKLYVDEAFPATLRSIGYGDLLKKMPATIQWKRPHEIEKNPQFFATNASRFDLHQGLSENCWFLAALASLTFHKDILANVVPQNQSFEKNYAGIFHFRFWRFGEWVDVVVDDQLPVNEDGKLIFVSSIHKNLFWGALLEKAYAKVCGSYEDMQIGQVSEALVDFTGGVNISIKLEESPPGLWDILLRAAYSGSLMGCQTLSGEERILENGLVAGHAYTLTGIRKVSSKSGSEFLVRLRNPWGKIEWKGDWSDCSSKWEQLSLKERVLLRRTREDGEFWMSMEDFKAHFVELVICKLTPDLMSLENGKKWTLSMQTGSWIAGESAGGRMSFRETFSTNPQFRLKIKAGDPMEKIKGSCNVLVSLLQKQTHKHRNQSPPLYIGFSVFKVPHEFHNEKRRLPRKFFDTQSPVNLKCVFINEREVTQDFRLVPGEYVIVPSTADPDQECEFILRVFSRKHTLQANGEQILCQKEISDKHDEKIWESCFDEFFQTNPEINVGQVQTLLNKKNWSNSRQKPVKFTLDGCKVIMAQLDLDTSGTLSLQEFRSLWKRLVLYQEMFQKRDVSRSGHINLQDLQAIAETKGIKLSNRFSNLMVTRYGDSSLKLTFENFVCFMLRMEINGGGRCIRSASLRQHPGINFALVPRLPVRHPLFPARIERLGAEDQLRMERQSWRRYSFRMRRPPAEVFHNLSRDGKGIYLQESEWMMLTLYS